MAPKVALVQFDEDPVISYRKAIELIGKIDDISQTNRSVVVKVGVFDHRAENHATVEVIRAVTGGFSKAPAVYLVESDSYMGKGLERLQVWKEVFSDKVIPFNLSEDNKVTEFNIADEKIPLSNRLLKPNAFVSVHSLRKYSKGTILKNLLGLIPDEKKVRFHKKLEKTLLDLYEAVGGIDLAVIDGTFTDLGIAPHCKRVKTDFLVVGRDAIAVEAVGAKIVGLNPDKMPLIQEATRRGLGEGNIKEIEILGGTIQAVRQKIRQSA